MEKRYLINKYKSGRPFDINHYYPFKFGVKDDYYTSKNYITQQELDEMLTDGGTKGLYKDMSFMFHGCLNLTSIPNIDTRNVTNMYYMFNACDNIETIPLLDTRNVTDMGWMFNACDKLTTIPLLDTRNVTSMGWMFNACDKLTTIPLLDTRNVISMYRMFSYCTNLTTIPNIDTRNVISMQDMFRESTNIETIHMININTDLDIHWCNKMDRNALLEVINNLVAQSSGTKRLTLGSTLKGRITSEDIAIATNKGWTIV